MSNDNDMPDMGRLATGGFLGDGTRCRWHNPELFKTSPKMRRNGKGAYLCAECDAPGDETYQQAMMGARS